MNNLIKGEEMGYKKGMGGGGRRKWERDIHSFVLYNIFLPPSSFHQVRSVWE